METPEGNTYDSLEDDFWFHVRWHLFNMRELQRMHAEELGEHNIMEDRFLQDFSLAWKGVPDYDPPQWLIEEAHAYREKATSTTVDFGNAVHVIYDDRSNRVGISTSRGFAEISRSQCAAIGQLLISLASAMPGGAMGSSDVSQRSAPKELSQNEKVAAYQKSLRRQRGW